MTRKKFDPKVFTGATAYEVLPGYANILRMHRWSKESKRYLPPKRGKIYQAYRYDLMEDGKRRRIAKMFNSLKEALDWQSSRSSEVLIGNQQTSIEQLYHKGPTLSEVVELHQKTSASVHTESTKIYYDKQIKNLEFLMDRKVQSLTAKSVDELVEHWLSKKAGPRRTSYRRELETLKYFLDWAVDNYDELSPIAIIKNRHRKKSTLKVESNSKRKFMFENEIDSFLDCLRNKYGDEWYAFALTQYLQIMRVSETAAMRWENLNLQRKEYFVCEHVFWPRVNGELPKLVPGTKNRKAHESISIPLFKEVIEVLCSQKKYPGCDLIFHDNGKLLTYRRIQYVYDSVCKAANLPFSGTHVMRHTGATLFQDRSGDSAAVQRLGGWKTARQCEHYAKVLPSAARNAIDKLERKAQLMLIKTDS